MLLRLLGWPSAPEAQATASIVLFADFERPIALGRLYRAPHDDKGKLKRPILQNPVTGRNELGLPHFPDDPTGHWYLKLDLAFDLDILDDRDKLEPRTGGYVIQLVVGADDGDARRYEVDIDWDGDAETPDVALQSALEHLAVRSLPRRSV